jgi:hypothetical protein
VLPDLPGIAQNLAFAHSSLDELPDIPFFEDNKSLPVLSPPMPVQEPQTRVVQQQEEQRTGPPLPPVEAPPTLPPFPPEPELPKASQPVQTTVPDRQPDEPGKNIAQLLISYDTSMPYFSQMGHIILSKTCMLDIQKGY